MPAERGSGRLESLAPRSPLTEGIYLLSSAAGDSFS